MSALTPVSFKKGRAHEPRLSEKYVPGKHSARYWSKEESAVVRTYYPEGGAPACEARLPNRTRTSIYAHAQKLGLGTPHKAAGEYRRIGTAHDDRIREAWPGLVGRGAVKELASQLGVPRTWLSGRALKLGLTLPHKKEPPWTAAEDALMRRVPLHDPKRASRIFQENGFARTPTAIVVRAKRLDLSRRTHTTLSAGRAAAILGVDPKFITARIIAGDIAAERRGTQRLAQQGGDTWAIEPAALKAYVLQHLEHVDIRKVDKFAFVELLTGHAELGGGHG